MRIILITTVFLLFFTSTALKAQSLCGYWAGYGYSCYKINLDGSTTWVYPPYELLYISQINDTLVATKIIGDDCVTAGFPSWKGLLIKNERRIKGTLYLGSPLAPNSSFRPVEISVFSADSLFIWGVPFTYKKLTCEQAQKLGADLSDTRYNCDCDNTQTCKIELPNAFTPNGDGLNDTFAPVTLCQFKNYEFKIFNRLGNLVFDSNDIRDAWKGVFKDYPLATDVYVWFLKTTGLNGKVTQQSGEVTLIR
jgi:gliding motility-associated-like protein